MAAKHKCKWGRRVKGKCPRKPARKRKATRKAPPRRKPVAKRKYSRPAPRKSAADKAKMTTTSKCPSFVWSKSSGVGDLRDICLAYLMNDGMYRCKGGLFIAGENPVSDFDIIASDVEDVLSQPKNGCPRVPVRRT